MRSDRLYVSPAATHRKQLLSLWKGAIHKTTTDWNAVGDDRGATVSTATWTTDDESVITISGATLSAGVATVSIEALASGSAEVKNTATFSDGSKAVAWWSITVKDDG